MTARENDPLQARLSHSIRRIYVGKLLITPICERCANVSFVCRCRSNWFGGAGPARRFAQCPFTRRFLAFASSSKPFDSDGFPLLAVSLFLLRPPTIACNHMAIVPERLSSQHAVHSFDCLTGLRPQANRYFRTTVRTTEQQSGI